MLFIYMGILFMFFIQPYTKQHYTTRRTFCLFLFVFVALCAALRDLKYGDLIGYRYTYLNLPYYSVQELIDLWKEGAIKDLGFYLWSKLLFADRGVMPQIWMTIIGVFYAFGFGFFTYKTSREPYLSMIVVITFYLGFTFTGIRQAMALAFTFIAYVYMYEEKPVKFIICGILASIFHSSSLIVLSIYLLAKLQVNWKNVAIPLACLGISIFAPNVFNYLIDTLAWNDNLGGYAGVVESKMTWSGYVIQALVYSFCLFFRKSIVIDGEERQKEIDGFINCMMVGLCFQSFATHIAVTFRMSYYFAMCSTTVIPNIVMYQKSDKTRKILRRAVLLCFILYLFWKRAYFGYIYFWQ